MVNNTTESDNTTGLFQDPKCLYTGTYECSFTAGGGGLLLIVIVLVVCIVSCVCLRRRRRRRRRQSRDITGSSAGTSAQNDYKIESLRTDATGDFSNGSGAADAQTSRRMRDFQNISLRVPNSFEPAEHYEGATGIKMTNIRSIPLEPPVGKTSQSSANSMCPRGHKYDDVLRSEASNSVEVSSVKPKPDGYSEAKTHTLVLSNVDTRGQAKQGHTYRLLDGSNPNEKATVMAMGSAAYSSTFSRDHSLKGNLASSNMNSGSNENSRSRRTTLSGIPTKSGVFDDPTYANTSITFPTGTDTTQPSNNGNMNSQKSETAANNMAAAAAPPRSRSLVQNPTERKSRKPLKPQMKPQIKHAPPESKITESPEFMQDTSTMFDDPTYDVGLNLPNT